LLRLLPCRFQPAGLHLLFESASACNIRFRFLAASSKSPAPPSGFRCFLPRGRGFYRFAAVPVNRCFVTSPTEPPVLLLPGLFFVGGAASTSLPRRQSTRFGDRHIPFVGAAEPASEVPSAPVRGLRCEGRGFYHHRVSSQPLLLTLSSLFSEPPGSCRPTGPSSGARLLPPPRLESTPSADSFFPRSSFPPGPASGQTVCRAGRGFYHRRVLSQPLP